MSDQASRNLLDLKSLAENRAGFARSALFDRVAGLLFASEGELTQEVRTLIDEILTDLIHQVDVTMRKQVAGRLCQLETAPRNLLMLLAQDELEIAQPILYHSPVLSAADLIEIAKAKSPEHREAIARRANVPADVVEALASFKEPRVLEALLANVGAVIPRNVFHDLVALSEKVETLRRQLIDRRDMPKDVAHQMFWFVSAAMRQAILSRFTVDADELDKILAESLIERDVVLKPTSREGRWTSGEVAALIAKAKAGDIPAFVRTLAELIGVDVAVANKIAADAGGEPLAIACKAVGADRSQFTTIVLQLDYKKYGKARPLSFLNGISQVFDAIPQNRAVALVQLWNAQNKKAA